MHGARNDLEQMRGKPDPWVSIEVVSAVLSPRRGAIGLGVIAATILLGATGAAPLSIALPSASRSFVTLLESACPLAYGPGRCRFRDTFRAGLPVTIIPLVLLPLALVPVIWPL